MTVSAPYVSILSSYHIAKINLFSKQKSDVREKYVYIFNVSLLIWDNKNAQKEK